MKEANTRTKMYSNTNTELMFPVRTVMSHIKHQVAAASLSTALLAVI